MRYANKVLGALVAVIVAAAAYAGAYLALSGYQVTHNVDTMANCRVTRTYSHRWLAATFSPAARIESAFEGSLC